MGNIVLRGISSALVVTVITLLAGMFWSSMGYGGLAPSSLVDIGLVVSCVTAGYRSGRESGVWFWGGVAALGYVSLSILLAALFLPISGWGAIQILAEGGVIGILAGAFGAGKALGNGSQRMGGDRLFSARVSRWGKERNEWDSWDKWDSPSDRSKKDGSANAQESEEINDFKIDSDGEWEEWMSEGLSSVKKEEDREYKPFKERGELENPRMRAEKNVWWEEDVY